MAEIFLLFTGKNRDYCEKLLEGKTIPTKKNLDTLEVNFQEILKAIDKVSKNCPHIINDSKCLDTKKGIQKTQKDLIPVCRQFATINDQINDLNKESFSWQKVRQLYEECQTIEAPNLFTTKTVKILKSNIVMKMTKNFGGIEKVIESGEFPV